jgi:hypothetical protein
MFNPNPSNPAEAKYEWLGRKMGDCFPQPMQREEVSSLPHAGLARHPTPTSAGLFLPATPTLRSMRKDS